MSDKQLYILSHSTARQRALQAVAHAPEGYAVRISEPRRNEDQSARFHAMCGDISKQCTHIGRMLSKDQWKVLLVSGHAIVTKEGADMVPGLEGEYVNLREPTSAMGKRRMASLIDYTRAFGDSRGVEWTEPAEVEA